MRHRGINEQAIPADGRLILWQRRHREAQLLDEQAKRIALEVGSDLPDHPNAPMAATPAGDELRLRGIPLAARGVAGVMPGTRPDTCRL